MKKSYLLYKWYTEHIEEGEFRLSPEAWRQEAKRWGERMYIVIDEGNIMYSPCKTVHIQGSKN